MGQRRRRDIAGFDGVTRNGGAAAGSVGSTPVLAMSRAVITGLAGTTVMSASLALERRLRGSKQPVDYDDQMDHVVAAATAVLRRVSSWEPTSDKQRRAVFLGVHWGYGSAVAASYPLMRMRASDRMAALGFFAACQTMAMTLFPTLGGTPPPWRWPATVLMSSLFQHALYAATVATADRALRGEATATDEPVALC